MKVSELVELLKYYDQDADVHFTYGYGDYWRTQVAPIVRDVTEEAVVYSAYHSMDKLVEDCDDEDEDYENKNLKRVVVIG